MNSAVVFIVLGVMTAGLAIVPAISMATGFGDTVSQDEESNFFVDLSNTIEDQCGDLDNYRSVVGSTVEGELHRGDIHYDEDEVRLRLVDSDNEDRRTRDIECGHEIVFEVDEGANHVIETGGWQAVVSGERESGSDEGSIEVEVSKD